MFSVNGKTLLEDDLHILSMLQSEIYNRTGITFLGKFIVSDTDIQFVVLFIAMDKKEDLLAVLQELKKVQVKIKSRLVLYIVLPVERLHH